MTSENLREVSDFAKREQGLGAVTEKGMVSFGYAMLTIAGADGDVSPKEMEWLVEHQRRLGAPERVIEQYASFDPKAGNLAELLGDIVTDVPGSPASTRLIYHAIHMCSADGHYAEQERSKVLAAAKHMNVDPGIVAALHALVEIEASVTKMRKALFGTETR